jgi:hypothetical protein
MILIDGQREANVGPMFSRMNFVRSSGFICELSQVAV